MPLVFTPYVPNHEQQSLRSTYAQTQTRPPKTAGQCLYRYLQRPSYISTQVLDQSAVGIPAITMCPDYNGRYKDDILRSYGYNGMREYYFKEVIGFGGAPGLNLTVDPEALFYEVTHSLWELVEYVKLDLMQPLNGSTELVLTNGTENVAEHFYEKRKRQFGLCHGLYPSKAVRDVGISRVEIK